MAVFLCNPGDTSTAIGTASGRRSLGGGGGGLVVQMFNVDIHSRHLQICDHFFGLVFLFFCIHVQVML